jgi:hypothetical protein
MKYISRVIYDDTWFIYLSEEKDDVVIDEGSEAETDFELKEIYFRKSELKLSTVRHEIWHMFYSYTFTNTADLDSLQMEEVTAELFAYQGKKIDKLADEIYTELRKLKDTK